MKGKGRRQFFEDVTKYCGAGMAAVGLISLHKAREAGAVEVLDTPVHSGTWRMRDVQLDQYGQFIKTLLFPRITFRRYPRPS